jgi:farnesyl-diphosphate farnesyltransferase
VSMLANGIRFGKGLQLVNILRDLPRDLQAGRCYLPEQPLRALGLSPGDLLVPAQYPLLQPLYGQYLDVAESHLSAGWAYTLSIPRGCIRLRLACAWPILIGMQTLAKLRNANPLDVQQRIKISRSEVRAVVLKSITLYLLRRSWEEQFRPSKPGLIEGVP